MILNNSFIIKCIVIRGNDVMVQEINQNIKSILSLYSPEVDFTLRSNRPYWKYPEDKEIIFKIKNNYECYVSDFIKNFNLTWDYTTAKAYEVDLQESYINEEAVWSRSVHPKEIFLIPEVSWVHVYTWPEDKV